jgi:hypothetical protein
MLDHCTGFDNAHKPILSLCRRSKGGTSIAMLIYTMRTAPLWYRPHASQKNIVLVPTGC